VKICRGTKKGDGYIVATPVVVVYAVQWLMSVGDEMYEERERFLPSLSRGGAVSHKCSILGNSRNDTVAVWTIAARVVVGSL
jgi:hypothetical protein